MLICACCAIAGVGQRKTTHFVLLTRQSTAGFIAAAIFAIFCGGTSEFSKMLFAPRIAMYASIFLIFSSEHAASTASLSSDAASASARFTRGSEISTCANAPRAPISATIASSISEGVCVAASRTCSPAAIFVECPQRVWASFLYLKSIFILFIADFGENWNVFLSDSAHFRLRRGGK